MAEVSTFIKLDRNIQKWRWYKDGNTMRVFIDLLLNANIADHDFMSITVHRGEVATSLLTISDHLNLTVRNVRTALNHLKVTREVTITRHSKFLLIRVENYEKYQNVTRYLTINCQSTDNQLTINRQQLKNIKNIKNDKNIKKSGDAAKFNLDGFAEFLDEEDGNE